MSDLSFGAHANVFLQPGEILRVSTSGEATVVAAYGAPDGTTTITAGTQDFGPYGVPAKLRVTAVSGRADYDRVDDMPLNSVETEAVRSLVSEYGNLLAALPLTTTWAERAAAVTAGRYAALFSDVGLGIAPMSYSGRWRWSAGRGLLKNLITTATHNTTAQAIMDYAVIPAGLVGDGDIIEVNWAKQLTGTDTDTTGLALSQFVAVWGTVLPYATSNPATANPFVSTRWRMRRINATTLRPAALSGAVGLGAGSTPADVTVPNMDDNTLYLQIGGKLTTGSGAVTSLLGFAVEHINGA